VVEVQEENCASRWKLIVTIVQKGNASRVLAAARKEGLEGETILPGRGTGIHEYKKLFGITLDPEKEVILSLVSREFLEPVLKAFEKSADLSKPGKGIGFVLDVPRAAGIVHLLQKGSEGGGSAVTEKGVPRYDLIVSIVDRGFADTILEITKEAGGKGGRLSTAGAPASMSVQGSLASPLNLRRRWF